ncbi:hypothetical protein [Desulfovibrio legallii]|jgi:hypothetical protein|uniref:DUF4956 domain-containing protein n=1 Tax=Desulfovibrio legallii TaxID=571438 RepID=A0A1G7P442_9BACT|nr:hypothetical protein [Desulfovibrio legallii]SDF80867.1 hypothetical protein SAMN05192586_11425 [Desulfovibrio legallii]
MTEELRKLLLLLSQQESLSFVSLATTMTVALGCGLAIYLLYKYFYRGVIYSENFGVLLLLVSGVTAFIIITIGTNFVLSLGMVGALSIVRFRAPIKDPLDVGFLYWSIAAGLTAGARLYMVAVFGTAVLGLVYILMHAVHKGRRVFLLILRYAAEAETAVVGLLAPLKGKLKNKSVSGGLTELTLEVRVKDGRTAFIEPLTAVPGVESATLVEYNGDYV